MKPLMSPHLTWCPEGDLIHMRHTLDIPVTTRLWVTDA